MRRSLIVFFPWVWGGGEEAENESERERRALIAAGDDVARDDLLGCLG